MVCRDTVICPVPIHRSGNGNAAVHYTIKQFNCWFLSALQMKPNWYDFAQKWILIRMNKYDQEDETGQSDLLGVIGRALPTFPSDGDERLLSSVTYSHPSMINKIQINETTRRDDG